MEERKISKKDLHRLDVLTGIQNKYIKQVRTVQIIGISTHQIQRLMSRQKEEGPKKLFMYSLRND